MRKLLSQLLLYNLIIINATIFGNLRYTRDDLQSGFRLPDYVIPEHYNIQLTPFFQIEGKSFYFSGRCVVYITIISSTCYISLHAQLPQIKIRNAVVVDRESSYSYMPTKFTYNKTTHILTFHFSNRLSNGQYLLNIRFTGLSNNDEKFFRTYYTDSYGCKGWFVATNIRAIGARQLFPCWDEPVFKATFNITIRHPLRYTIVSSMPKEYIIKDRNY